MSIFDRVVDTQILSNRARVPQTLIDSLNAPQFVQTSLSNAGIAYGKKAYDNAQKTKIQNKRKNTIGAELAAAQAGQYQYAQNLGVDENTFKNLYQQTFNKAQLTTKHGLIGAEGLRKIPFNGGTTPGIKTSIQDWLENNPAEPDGFRWATRNPIVRYVKAYNAWVRARKALIKFIESGKTLDQLRQESHVRYHENKIRSLAGTTVQEINEKREKRAAGMDKMKATALRKYDDKLTMKQVFDAQLANFVPINGGVERMQE